MTNCIKCKKEIPKDSLFCLYCGKKQASTEGKKAKRRPNGSGTVYKVKGRRRKPWAAATTKYVNCIKETVFLGYFTTEKEALEALTKIDIQNIPTEYNSTLADVYKMWSNTHFQDVSEKSVEGYELAWKHLTPCHKKKMRDIRTSDFQSVIDNLVRMGRSRSLCNKIRILANQLSKYAMERDITSKNYAQFIKLPKEEKSEKQIFTDAEIKILFKNKWKQVAQIILVFIYTGMRIEELFSIEIKNVHLKERYMIGGEKTEAGKDRIIPINEKIYPFIEGWYSPDNKYLLTNSKGGKKNARNFREREFYPFLEEVGILSKEDDKRRLTPHSTRHTFASMMVQAGAQPELLQKIIGHENYETTIDTYTHFTKDDISSMVSQVNII